MKVWSVTHGWVCNIDKIYICCLETMEIAHFASMTSARTFRYAYANLDPVYQAILVTPWKPTCCGLVQEDERRPLEQPRGHREALALPPGQAAHSQAAREDPADLCP